MRYVVQPGDTLWRLAARFFGDAEKWRLIQQDNPGLSPRQLLVGDEITIRDAAAPAQPAPLATNSAPPRSASEQRASLIPGRAFLFVLADEVDPLSRKVVRKVMVNPTMAAEWATRLGKPVQVVPSPESFGLLPTDPSSRVSVGRHALGQKPSPFSSASTQTFGAARFSGSRFWIDVEQARAAGATFHETPEIVQDLARIAAKTRNADQAARIARVRQLVVADGEVLIRGAVPASAIKGAGAMAATRVLQGVQVVGFVMTAVDLGNATTASISTNSIRPIAAETIRQAGGWAAAWAGMKLGAAAGAAVGIEAGPGAILTGAAGGVIGGVAGYCGFDWVADTIYEN